MTRCLGIANVSARLAMVGGAVSLIPKRGRFESGKETVTSKASLRTF